VYVDIYNFKIDPSTAIQIKYGGI